MSASYPKFYFSEEQFKTMVGSDAENAVIHYSVTDSSSTTSQGRPGEACPEGGTLRPMGDTSCCDTRTTDCRP